MSDSKEKRAIFNTRFGVIAATVGSAVGLGNIWRFPYETANNGGGAFLLCYLFFILIIGIPVLCAEFSMGRAARSNIFGAFGKLHKGGHWKLTGYIAIASSLMILSFYSVVAGWTVEYLVQSATGGLSMASEAEYHEGFASFTTGWRPVLWTVVFLFANYLILARGVTKGIERMSNIFMPAMFILLIIFCINSLAMPGATDGLQFLFEPDFSAITPSVVLGAMGQAFFSLSLGLGCMLTYASYFSDRTRLVRSAATTALLDFLVAILAGVIIFPAMFTYGTTDAAGPALVFEVLPTIFHQLPGGMIWSTLFFFFLFIASLSSTISMSEISISYFIEQFGMKRRPAALLNTAIALVFGTLCALSFGILGDLKVLGMTIFDLFNNVSSNILLPVGGMIISLFVGWKMSPALIRRQLTNNGTVRVRTASVIIFCIRYIAPAGIALVLLNSVGLL